MGGLTVSERRAPPRLVGVRSAEHRLGSLEFGAPASRYASPAGVDCWMTGLLMDGGTKSVVTLALTFYPLPHGTVQLSKTLTVDERGSGKIYD